MTYCLNPTCNKPKNPPDTLICHNCGSKLLLRDRYQILNVLGKGGFGMTFAARDISISQEALCVIKQLRPMSKDAGVLEMSKTLFEREAKILGRVLQHPQVPKLLDYFEVQEQFYLVQEYINGHNMHREVKMNGCFSEAAVKQFISEIIPILQYIHSKKLVHRDIKPANLIRRVDDRKLVLIDFGAVKDDLSTFFTEGIGDDNSYTAFAVGTAGFAPPEQLARRPVYASDIYALGMTCIFLLTGKTPKSLGSDPRTGEIKWQNQVKVSPEFTQVLEKMLALSLAQRFQSVEQVLKALELLPYEESMKQSMVTWGKPVQQQKSLDQNSRFLEKTIHTHSLSNRNKSRRINNKEKPQEEKLNAPEILKKYKLGKKNFSGKDLTGLSLTKINIEEINLYQANLTKINLQGSILKKANLGRISGSQSILKNTNLSQAYLVYANLEFADLRGADLSYANLKFANLTGANLCGANLRGAQVTKEQLSVAKTNWFTVWP